MSEKDPTVGHLVPKPEDVETMVVDGLKESNEVVEKPTATIAPIAVVKEPIVVETMTVEEPATTTVEKAIVKKGAVAPKRKLAGAKARGGARKVGKRGNISRKVNNKADVNEVMKALETATTEQELEKIFGHRCVRKLRFGSWISDVKILVDLHGRRTYVKKSVMADIEKVEPILVVEKQTGMEIMAESSDAKVSESISKRTVSDLKSRFENKPEPASAKKTRRPRAKANLDLSRYNLTSSKGKTKTKSKTEAKPRPLNMEKFGHINVALGGNKGTESNTTTDAAKPKPGRLKSGLFGGVLNRMFGGKKKSGAAENGFPAGFEPEKYLKMHKAGLPPDVIKHKLKSEGHKGREEELFRKLFIDPKPVAAESGFPRGFNPATFRKMKKVGVPDQSIMRKIGEAGFKDQAEALFEKMFKEESKPKPVAKESIFPAGFDEEKYRRMEKVGLPPPLIKRKIMLDGYKGQEEELFRKLFSNSSKPAAAEIDAPNSAETDADAPKPTETVVYPDIDGFHPTKYKRMMRIKLPDGMIINALTKDGFGKQAKEILSLLKKDNKPVFIYPRGFDDNKYKMMLKVKLPEALIKNAIIRDDKEGRFKDGVDKLLEKLKKDPNKPSAAARPSGGLNFTSVKLKKSSPAASRATQTNSSTNKGMVIDKSQIKNALAGLKKRKRVQKVARKGSKESNKFSKPALRRTNSKFIANNETEENKQSVDLRSRLKKVPKSGSGRALVTNKTKDNKPEPNFARVNLKKRVVKQKPKKQAVEEPSWIQELNKKKQKKVKQKAAVVEDTPLEKTNQSEEESKTVVGEVAAEDSVVTEEPAAIDDPAEEALVIEESAVTTVDEVATEEPVVNEEPAATVVAGVAPEEPVVTEEPAAIIDEPAAETVVIEDPAVTVVDEVATEEPVAIEPVEETFVVEELSAIEVALSTMEDVETAKDVEAKEHRESLDEELLVMGETRI